MVAVPKIDNDHRFGRLSQAAKALIQRSAPSSRGLSMGTFVPHHLAAGDDLRLHVHVLTDKSSAQIRIGTTENDRCRCLCRQAAPATSACKPPHITIHPPCGGCRCGSPSARILLSHGAGTTLVFPISTANGIMFG